MVDCVLVNEKNNMTEAIKILKIHNKKFIGKTHELAKDLNKCLYFSLEKISEKSENEFSQMTGNKFNSVFILGVGAKFDETYSTIVNVNEYLNTDYSLKTEFYLIGKNQILIFLKNGTNLVFPSEKLENKLQGYSITSIQNDIYIKVSEFTDDHVNEFEQKLKFTNVISRNNFYGNKLIINVNGITNGFVLYSVNTL